MNKTALKLLSATACTAVCILGTVAVNASAVSSNLGDTNSDGKIDSADATDILSAYANLSIGSYSGWTDKEFLAADVNNDGKVDSTDASGVLDYYTYASTGGNDSIYKYFNIEEPVNLDEINFDAEDLFSNINVLESYDPNVMQFGLRWNPVEGATNYHVEFYTDQYDENGQPFKYEKDVASASFTAQLDSVLNGSAYLYRITPYAKSGNEEKWSEQYYVSGTKDHASRAGYTVSDLANTKLIVNSAQLTPHYTYPLYNIKYDNAWGGVPTQTNTYSVSDDDIAIIENFAAEHFTQGMTNYDKIVCFMEWIHENLTYADGVNGRPAYSTIWSYSFVDACINHKAGQCIQYNGALAELLSYMGYDAYLMEMYTSGQHFRAELSIDGVPYGMEVGENTYDSGTYKWMWWFDTSKANLPASQRPAD